MDYEKLCNEIMNLDSLIRFAAILNQKGEKIAGGTRENISSMLSPEEVQMSMYYASRRWDTRGKLSHRIGDAKYSMTAYDKVNQITIPVDKKNLLLLSTEPSVKPIEIIDKVIELIKNN
jgi:hypothetical protein